MLQNNCSQTSLKKQVTIQDMMSSRQHMTNALEQLNNASDTQFLQIAQYFKQNKLSLQEYVTALDYIKKRCNRLGYTFTKGCCGNNTLEKNK